MANEVVNISNIDNTAVQNRQNDGISPFHSINSFTDAWRMARCLSASSMVPDAFRGEEGTPNCMIALELASRLKTSIFMIMQNMYVIHGRPAFSSQFIIASIQACGRYSPLRYIYKWDANGTPTACKAVATELSTGEVLEGPEVSMEMARAEGWLAKSGSKWKTMPEVMLRYRAASFFGRAYAPDVMMGFKSAEEVYDTESTASRTAPAVATAVPLAEDDGTLKPRTNNNKTAELNALVGKKSKPKTKVESKPEESEIPKADLDMEPKKEAETSDKEATVEVEAKVEAEAEAEALSFNFPEDYGA